MRPFPQGECYPGFFATLRQRGKVAIRLRDTRDVRAAPFREHKYYRGLAEHVSRSQLNALDDWLRLHNQDQRQAENVPL